MYVSPTLAPYKGSNKEQERERTDNGVKDHRTCGKVWLLLGFGNMTWDSRARRSFSILIKGKTKHPLPNIKEECLRVKRSPA